MLTKKSATSKAWDKVSTIQPVSSAQSSKTFIDSVDRDDKAVTLRQLHRSKAEHTTQNTAIGPLTRTVLLTKLPRTGTNRKSIHRGVWVKLQSPCISGPRIKHKIVSGMGYKLPTNQVPNNRIIKREAGLTTASFTASSGVFILYRTVLLTRAPYLSCKCSTLYNPEKNGMGGGGSGGVKHLECLLSFRAGLASLIGDEQKRWNAWTVPVSGGAGIEGPGSVGIEQGGRGR